MPDTSTTRKRVSCYAQVPTYPLACASCLYRRGFRPVNGYPGGTSTARGEHGT
jgi:hypothetical protein